MSRYRPQCKDCSGSNIRVHGKEKYTCINCTPSRACSTCKAVYVHPNYRFHPQCFRCYCVSHPDIVIPRRYKLKEHHLQDAFKAEFPDTKIVFDQRVDGGCSLRRSDVRIECGTHSTCRVR